MPTPEFRDCAILFKRFSSLGTCVLQDKFHVSCALALTHNLSSGRACPLQFKLYSCGTLILKHLPNTNEVQVQGSWLSSFMVGVLEVKLSSCKNHILESEHSNGRRQVL